MCRQVVAETPSEVGSPSGSSRYYRPELDILRFVAFLMVYLCHAIPVTPDSPHWVKALSCSTAFGVPIFFALSAYLITELLILEKDISGSIRLRSFYLRRCLRIWPLYFLLLFSGYALSRVRPRPELPLSALVSYFFLMGNWYSSRHDFLPHGLGPLWSVPVEEQFYLFWPLLVRSLRRRYLGIICCFGWVCSQLVVISLCELHLSFFPTLWANSFVQLQYFALGAGVSLYLKGAIPEIRGALRILMIGAGFLSLFAADFVLNPGAPNDASSLAHTYPELLLAGVSITAILAGFLGYRGCYERKILRYLGKISYGLYLCHIPCLLLVEKATLFFLGHNSPLLVVAMGLPMTIGIAAISYRFLESPFLRLKERFAVVQSRPV